ncbi:hypothetical protein PLEOSDRAFT_165755 [Pleurotus ostreatus PC15]|uniref:DUF6533 domain-containing protein n=1 Tax=Pleurotus ostreatus (strain PC15) TaxID=1137138 RepID=A0A067P2L2_PLEO1|nr:hypothetical protein PLEOSDRAFT_165755 [Pleurotus ostreatus PC15]
MERPTLQGLFQLRQEEVYDYLVTFGDEVTFIWTKPKSLGTILYFLARYPVFVDLVLSLYGEYLAILVLFIDALNVLVRITPRLPVDQCIALDHAMGWMFLIGIAVAESQSMSLSPGELIMIMRVWSLWGRTQFMTVFLSILTIATLIVGVTVLGLSQKSLTSPNMSGCYPLGSNGAMLVDYAILMGFEANVSETVSSLSLQSLCI